MDETVLKVAIAGFIHDIGKMIDESALPLPQQYMMDNADLYQPFYQGRHTHRHALYTAAFIERFEALLPSKLNMAGWGLEDSFINLAAGHHKPFTPMQWIIAIADRVSSGWDRAKFDEEYNQAVPVRDYKVTRLLPMFEHLMNEDEGMVETLESYCYCYPLEEISPKNIFPALKTQASSQNRDVAATDYRALFDEFQKVLGTLLHREENLQLWFEHFESLMMIFASSIPAARVGNVIPDVSLYDHMKATSAVATALYLYHREKDSMSIEAIRDYESKKFLIVAGDFYGIQDFIFSNSGEAGKNRSKMLRGRSFAVSLFSELAADMLCREIGIPSISVVLNAAGKFTIIAPNTESAMEAIASVERRLNEWLIKMSFGENAIGVSFFEASPEDFVNGKFIQVWDHLALEMEKKKFGRIDLERFGGVVPGYLDNFRNDLRRPLCPFCGKRPSSPLVEGSAIVGLDESACTLCHDHILLGTHLVKKNRLAISTSDAELWSSAKLMEPIFGSYQVTFVDGEMKDLARSGHLLKYWDISIDPEGRVAKGVTAKFINGYVPVYRSEDMGDVRLLAGEKSEEKKEELIDLLKEGVPKTFGHIANKALNADGEGQGFCGIEALGILKADVDQLGLLMACGLKPERFTLSRLATLSRQMNWYFAVYLPHLLKTDPRFADVYTVFAGGDDLFLIGPWNRAMELVGVLHHSFDEYVCHNPQIHFSAGISLHKPHTPLDRLAEGAEDALTNSKHEGRNRFTMFGETVTWDEFEELQKIKNTLQEWLDKNLINNAMIYRLNDFIRMAEMDKVVRDKEEVHLHEMECLKWRALFHYSAERNVGRGLSAEDRMGMRSEFLKAVAWLEKYGSRLKIALWDIIYNRR